MKDQNQEDGSDLRREEKEELEEEDEDDLKNDLEELNGLFKIKQSCFFLVPFFPSEP